MKTSSSVAVSTLGSTSPSTPRTPFVTKSKVPIRMSFGNNPPRPDVTTFACGRNAATPLKCPRRILSESAPIRMPCALSFPAASILHETRIDGSVSSRTSAVCGETDTTRPTSPSGTTTAAPSQMPERDPLPTRITSRVAAAPPPDDRTSAASHAPGSLALYPSASRSAAFSALSREQSSRSKDNAAISCLRRMFSGSRTVFRTKGLIRSMG